MKKVILALLIGTAIFGQDCTKMLQSANEDFKNATAKWDSNSQTASYYSIRGSAQFQQYMECMNIKRHQEILKAISKIKLDVTDTYTYTDSSEKSGSGY